jgi:hypothetical protein
MVAAQAQPALSVALAANMAADGVDRRRTRWPRLGEARPALVVAITGMSPSKPAVRKNPLRKATLDFNKTGHFCPLALLYSK